MQKTADGSSEFPTYFAYRQEMDKATGQFTTVMVPRQDENGNPTMVAQSFRVVFTDTAKATKAALDLDNKYPYLLADLEDGVDFTIAVDKDKDGKTRTDKAGKPRYVIFLKSIKSYAVAPKRSLTFEDVESESL